MKITYHSTKSSFTATDKYTKAFLCRFGFGSFLLNVFFVIIIIFLPGNLEVEASKKQAELDKKAMDELLRERDVLNKVSLLQ